MHCRDISEERFHIIASELINLRRRTGDFQTLTGHHKDYGTTILVRDATRCMAVVDDATLLDAPPPRGFPR